jgi:hypothetical protein
MAGDWVEKSALVKFAGLALGIMIGGPLGPVVFTPLGLGIPAASTVGAFIGAILGYVATPFRNPLRLGFFESMGFSFEADVPRN